ncbi:MAG: hypothetical protein ACOY40_17280 [Bacillota bacterium]
MDRLMVYNNQWLFDKNARGIQETGDRIQEITDCNKCPANIIPGFVNSDG